jgi:two-component system, cell cycle response regulator
VLCIDDNEGFLLTVSAILEEAGHTVRTASNGPDGIEIARSWHPGCILLDYIMPGLSGEEVVQEIRAFDRRTQIVLVTGLASRPMVEMMQRLDIQGYHSKADGPEKLQVWVGAALKAYEQVTLIERQAATMRRIFEATPLIHRFQPEHELLETALVQGLRLVEPEDNPRPDAGGLAVMLADSGVLAIGAAIGRFRQFAEFQDLPEALRTLVLDAVSEQRPRIAPDLVVLPVASAAAPLGVLVFDAAPLTFELAETIQLLTRQVALALENIRLHELAAFDSLTNVYTRRHVLQRFTESVRFAVRDQRPIGVILLDVDHFKRLNDEHGHLIGDRALTHIGACIRGAIRDTDAAGRYGGEEFIVFAPSTDEVGMATLAERIRHAIASTPEPRSDLRCTVSIGYGALRPPYYEELQPYLNHRSWRDLALGLVATVDQALYAAKRAGRDRCQAAGEDGVLNLING